jgi:hypothetical protein
MSEDDKKIITALCKIRGYEFNIEHDCYSLSIPRAGVKEFFKSAETAYDAYERLKNKEEMMLHEAHYQNLLKQEFYAGN